MSVVLVVCRALCALIITGLGILSATQKAWVACVCLLIVAWHYRPDVLKRRPNSQAPVGQRSARAL